MHQRTGLDCAAIRKANRMRVKRAIPDCVKRMREKKKIADVCMSKWVKKKERKRTATERDHFSLLGHT